MAKRKNPFKDAEGLNAVVKNLEPRWGLTLASFLPSEATERLLALQQSISADWQPEPETDRSKTDPVLTFYLPEHQHITHLTLRRSNAWGPVRRSEFVRPDHDLFELFGMIAAVTASLQPITVVLNQLTIGEDRLGLVLRGYCAGDQSKGYRTALLHELNATLPQAFTVKSRRWDNDPAHYHAVHTALGYLKRPPSRYSALVEYLDRHTFEPLVFALDDITLVHHRYRSLIPPHEGAFYFPLGEMVETTADEFARMLNLSEDES